MFPPTDLVETNVLSLLSEALTAEVELVLADKTSLVLADSAISNHRQHLYSISVSFRSRSRGMCRLENRTIVESPCRSFGGASSRRFRET